MGEEQSSTKELYHTSIASVNKALVLNLPNNGWDWKTLQQAHQAFESFVEAWKKTWNKSADCHFKQDASRL